MQALPLLVILLLSVWGVIRFCFAIFTVRDWQYSYSSGDDFEGVGVNGDSCHAGHSTGDLGSCDVDIEFNLGGFH